MNSTHLSQRKLFESLRNLMYVASSKFMDAHNLWQGQFFTESVFTLHNTCVVPKGQRKGRVKKGISEGRILSAE